MIVIPPFDEEEPIPQQIVRLLKGFAEKRTPMPRNLAILHLAPDAVERRAGLADHVPAPGLNFRDFRPNHVRLLAVLEKLAARTNPILALHQNARKLAPQFRKDVFQQRQMVQHVGFDGLLEFRPRQRRLQYLGQQLAERRMFRRGGLPILFLAVQQVHVHRLPDQIQQIFPRELRKSRAQEDVIVYVVYSEREVRQANFGGVRLKLHLRRMGGRNRDWGFGHSVYRLQSMKPRISDYSSERKCPPQWN